MDDFAPTDLAPALAAPRHLGPSHDSTVAQARATELHKLAELHSLDQFRALVVLARSIRRSLLIRWLRVPLPDGLLGETWVDVAADRSWRLRDRLERFNGAPVLYGLPIVDARPVVGDLPRLRRAIAMAIALERQLHHELTAGRGVMRSTMWLAVNLAAELGDLLRSRERELRAERSPEQRAALAARRRRWVEMLAAWPRSLRELPGALNRSLPLANRLTGLGIGLLPPGDRPRYQDEWIGELAWEVEASRPPLRPALRYLVGAVPFAAARWGRLCWRSRFGRRVRRLECVWMGTLSAAAALAAGFAGVLSARDAPTRVQAALVVTASVLIGVLTGWQEARRRPTRREDDQAG